MTTYRLPPNKRFVTLSEAVSWIAFRTSMNRAELAEVLGKGDWTKLPEPGTYGDLDDLVTLAVERLTDLAAGGEIAMRGKFFPSVLVDGDEIDTDDIPSVRFADYRQFATLDDALYRGTGLAWDSTRRNHPPLSDEHFRFVTLSRTNLLEHFPSTSTKKNSKGRRGRKPGSGSYAQADVKLFPEMKRLIDSGEAFSANEAASMVANKAAGHGCLASKASRLRRRFCQSPFHNKE